MILLNFKTYPESTGENAVFLADYLREIRELYGVEVVACPQSVDIRNVQQVLPDATWAQEVDPFDRGRATGYLLPEVVKEAGAAGVLLNHCEHKVDFET